MSEPTVSVCIRAFARPAGLRAAIESVLAQSFRDLEVVVSDDSGRLEHVARASGDPRVRYHANPRPAGSLANTRTVIGLARGRLLALLDDDDRWLPEFLATVVDRLEREPDLGIVFSGHYLEASGRLVPRHLGLAGGRLDSPLRELLEYSPIPPCAALMRREVWEEGERAYPLDSGVADFTIWLRAAVAGWPFYHIDRPLAVYALHPDQMSWSDEAMPAKRIATLERFRFDAPACERLRRARLAEARLAQAHLHLRRGRWRSAWLEIARARTVAPRRLGVRGALELAGVRPFVIRRLAGRPALLTAGAAAWRRLRPRVSPEPRGVAR